MERKVCSLLAALVFFVGFLPVGAQEVVLDFSTNGWGMPAAVDKDSAFTFGGYTVKITARSGYKTEQGSSCLFLSGKDGALTLPAFPFGVGRMEVVGDSLGSASVKQNIYVNTIPVSSTQTGSKGTNSFDIKEKHQHVGTVYSVKNENSGNSRITAVKVYKAFDRDFDEEAESVFNPATGASVKLWRTLSSEYWNTFCPPFDIAANQVRDVLGEGTLIARYARQEDDVMHFEYVDAMEAGKAYLLKPTVTVSNPLFTGVTVNEGVDADRSKVGGTHQFYGVLGPSYLDASTDLFITADGTVSGIGSGSSDSRIKGMRAYIHAEQQQTGSATRSVRLALQGELTSIESLDGGGKEGEASVARAYDLAGRAASQPSKGLFIVNGKKVALKK